MSANEGTWRAESRDPCAPRWPIAEALLASVIIALALAAFLLVRRTTGALVEPLPALALAATALALFAWMWGVRIAWAGGANRGAIISPRADQLVAVWLPLLTLTLVAVACSYPGRRVVDWLVWLPVIVANSIGPQALDRWRRQHVVRATPSTPPIKQTAMLDDPGTLLQELTRTRTAEGREAVHGTLVAEFAPGDRNATLHVAFCPPFESLPCVEAEIAEGSDASVKVAQILHNGARLEVRLATAAIAAASVSIDFFASEPSE